MLLALLATPAAATPLALAMADVSRVKRPTMARMYSRSRWSTQRSRRDLKGSSMDTAGSDSPAFGARGAARSLWPAVQAAR